MAKKALLLGAGFSYDLRIPLAKGITEDLFSNSRMYEVKY